MSVAPRSLGHRRQNSTPFKAKAPTMMAAAAPPYRGHRRGQTVDYGSFGPQIAIDRRNTPKTVTQLRDFYNEKSAIPCQQATMQQNQAYFPVAERQFVPADLSAHQTYQFSTPTAVRDQCQAFTHEQLQGIHAQVGDMTSSRMTSSLSRPRSQCSETASLNGPLNHIHQEPERLRRNLRSNQHPSQAHIETDDWELFPQRCSVGMPPNVAMPGRHNRQDISVKAETSPEMSHAHISSSYFPLTPRHTPSKRSFDLSMYSSDLSPSKQLTQSFPPQMPSPASSPLAPAFAELAAMPSPGSCQIKPQKIESASPTPSDLDQVASPTSSPIKGDMDACEESMSQVDLDTRVKACLRKTGISNEKINQYISGPDAQDAKWDCLFPGCSSRFGRKENIRSHVQTHLGDRPYHCDVCTQHFVRGHDLKRHLKTHAGSKPFVCPCGANFVRMDALTRHRQRGMCIGGINGIQPKTTKRGRPPKNSRPDMETRIEKATRTRRRVAQNDAQQSPTTTHYETMTEASSSRSSPALEDAAALYNSPVHHDAPMFNSPNYGNAYPVAPSSYTPPASPGNSTGNLPSAPFSPSFDDDMLPMSPPQLSQTTYESALSQYDPSIAPEPYTKEYLYSDPDISPHDMSSPYTAPTLAESVGSELDPFINKDPVEDFDKEFASLTNQSMSSYPTSYPFVDASDFASTTSFYNDKSFVSLSSLGEDTLSEQIENLSNEFLVDP
ncbi:hypothetical protein N7510_011168 [Penicillium lagena]|uniref:uncharacterized protein n=1 Tax=Penicillium lagena TaxID=94218 RepID=UPI0025425385|nr:uncharacterized protein N7510_011168 [Penicillium lagena]KAJ5601634.1 hypothetical protein N7510_011168 [Penicillium lagena]